MLGRTRERAELVAILEGAREGRSAAVVLFGEAGIGKSTLLEAAIEAAAGFRVVRARGYEAEADLPFAALLDLLSPLLDLVDGLPEAQATALRGALALGPASPHDRFAVPAALLSLLGAAAEEQPVLAVVDDVHWLDQASREALLFAARRLAREGVVLLLAARAAEGFDPREAGLPVMRVEGLELDAAREVLEQAAGPLPATVSGSLLATAGGNPLALVEIPRGLSAEQLTGRETLPSPLPPGQGIDVAFRRQLEGLDEEARSALVLLAAMQTGRADVLHAALERERLPREALDRAAAAGAVRSDGARLEFRHPLLRSAVYHAAAPHERRAAHDVLAAVSPDPARRAWHLANAAIAPDESVAGALEDAALDARARGGSASAAAGFERAAELSVDGEARARRQLEAARDLSVVGVFDRALELLDDALRGTHDPVLQTDVRRARGTVELRRGAPLVAFAQLEAEARRLEKSDPARAARTLIEGSVAHMMTGDMNALESAARRALALASNGVDPVLEAVATLIIGETLLALGRTDEGDALLDAVVPAFLEGDVLAGVPEIVGMAGHSAIWIERWDRAELVLDRLVGAAREASAIGLLIYPLAARSHLDFRRARWRSAHADAAESVDLARQTGQIGLLAHSLTALAHVEAALGHSDDAQRHGREALDLTTALGNEATRVYALAALALDDLAGGRVESAIGLLDEAQEISDRLEMEEPSLVQWAPDHVEALARAGAADRAAQALARFTRQAEATQRTWALAAAARGRGLLAGPEEFAEHFEAALVHHEGDGQPFERARTELAFAERLRRERRRGDARPHLERALDTFERLGARPWIARARAELELTGGATGPRPEHPSDELTPSELKIALLVAEGLTNREVAAALFLSPKTVEHHLSHIYRKLGVRSRTQLARRYAGERPPAGVA